MSDERANAIIEDRRRRRQAEEAQRRAREVNARKAAQEAAASDPSDPFAGARAKAQVMGGVANADHFGKNQRP